MDTNWLDYGLKEVSIGTNPMTIHAQEFKQEAVILVVDGGLSVAEVSRRLSISH